MKRITSKDIRSISDIHNHRRAIRKDMRETKGRIQHKLEHMGAEWAVTKSVSKSIYTVMSFFGGRHKFLKKFLAYGGTIASQKAIHRWFDEHQQEDLKKRFKETAEKLRFRSMEAVYKGSEPVLNFLQNVFHKKNNKQ